ncbi:IS4 family transposase, partial [Escherichia coli]
MKNTVPTSQRLISRRIIWVEETFRDLKSPAYGLGLRHSRTSSSE